MTKKEFSEIKKTLTTANTGFSRMFASYIPLDGDPVKLNTSGFLAKSEDEVELYFELFKKTLSGTIGKQLVMADFNNSSEEDGMQSKLYGVLKSRDDDPGSVDSITANLQNPITWIHRIFFLSCRQRMMLMTKTQMNQQPLTI